MSAKEIREKQMKFGFVFQQFNLFPQYNVLENVTLAPKLLAKERPDGSTVLAYDQKIVDSIDPQDFFDKTNDSVVYIDHETLEIEHIANSFDEFLDCLYD